MLLDEADKKFASAMENEFKRPGQIDKRVPVEGANHDLGNGDVVIAAITSCTNTSNPNVMIGAGLLARNANALGLKVKPWVKTSLAPGSQVVTEYLKSAGLQKELNKLGFDLVGYGCTTCIGNSGPLPEPISEAVHKNDLVVTSVLSGNRNFEGRISPDVRANYLASPPLVVAYALAGSMNINLATDPLGEDRKGNPVYLKDIWPTSKEIADTVRKSVTRKAFQSRYKDVFKGDAQWRKIKVDTGLTYSWDSKSTYVQHPTLFRRHVADAGSGRKHHRCTRSRAVSRFDHHGPHFAGRRHQGGEPGRALPARFPGEAVGLQFLRFAARQPPGNDARHVRQHPHQEPDGARRGRRVHQALFRPASNWQFTTPRCATRPKGCRL